MKIKKFLIISLVLIVCILLFGCSKFGNEKSANTLATNSDTVVYYAESSTYFSNYLPSCVLDDDSVTSWVLNDDKFGKDEWIKINFDKSVKVKKLYILNGLGEQSDKDFKERAYFADNRVKTLEAEFSNGEKEIINLKDGIIEEQEIILDKIINTEYIKLTIKDTYKGESRPKLTCIGSIGVNYPRVESNKGYNNRFNGIYGDYNKVKDMDFCMISKYIDYNEKLDMKDRVQYLADLLVDEYYDGCSIEISKTKNGNLLANLSGEKLISAYEGDLKSNALDRFMLESNLIQYYYKGEWIRDIRFSKYNEEFNLEDNSYLNKEYVKYTYLKNQDIYDSILENLNSDSKDNTETKFKESTNHSSNVYCIYSNNQEHYYEGSSCLAEDYNHIKYSASEAENLVYQTIYKNSYNIDINPTGMPVYLKRYHFAAGVDKIGYVVYMADLSGMATMTIPYFVDAYTGEIYEYNSFIGRKIQ